MGNAAGNHGTARTQMLPMVGAPLPAGAPQAGVQHAVPQGAAPHRPASTLLGQIEATAQARISNQQGYPPQEAFAQAPPQRSNAAFFIALGISLVVGAAAAVFFLYGPAEARQSSSSKPAGETEAATETASEPSAKPPPQPSAASSVELLTSESAASSGMPSTSAPQASASQNTTAPATVVKTGPRPTGTVPPTATTAATATTKTTGTVKGRDIRPDL